MSDRDSTLHDLKMSIKKFRDARDWSQFHDPKNLTEALVIEAGELLEHFLWKDKKQIAKELESNAEFREEVSDELADVFGYVLLLSEATGIDLARARASKQNKNDKKYPVAKSKGRFTKYTKL